MFKHWIYTPCSGSKIFAHSPCNEVVLVTYANGSHEVFHLGTALTWEAARQGSHFREPLRTLLGKLIPTIGGVAWDERGTVGCIVPRHLCSVVLDHVEALVEALGCHTEGVANRAKMVVADLAGYVYYNGKLKIDPLWVDPFEDLVLRYEEIDNPDYAAPPDPDSEEYEEHVPKPTHIYEITGADRMARTSPSLYVRDIEGGSAV